LPRARTEFGAGLRASLPVLIAVGPFGLVTGVAIVVAWRYRVTFGTITAGLLALHFFDWIF
jgi:predicted branched-subunit amino acid permease